MKFLLIFNSDEFALIHMDLENYHLIRWADQFPLLMRRHSLHWCICKASLSRLFLLQTKACSIGFSLFVRFLSFLFKGVYNPTRWQAPALHPFCHSEICFICMFFISWISCHFFCDVFFLDIHLSISWVDIFHKYLMLLAIFHSCLKEDSLSFWEKWDTFEENERIRRVNFQSSKC